MPQEFSHHANLQCFSALSNVHTLDLRNVKLCHFIPPGIDRYFGHFSSTLRSVALLNLFVLLDSYHISSLYLRTWTTSRSANLTGAYLTQ